MSMYAYSGVVNTVPSNLHGLWYYRGPKSPGVMSLTLTALSDVIIYVVASNGNSIAALDALQAKLVNDGVFVPCNFSTSSATPPPASYVHRAESLVLACFYDQSCTRGAGLHMQTIQYSFLAVLLANYSSSPANPAYEYTHY